METYKKDEVVFFFSSKDPHFELSNMAAGMPIIVNGLTWNSSEALYQAAKYPPSVICLPEAHKKGTDPNVRRRILFARNAMGAKMTQKCAVKAGHVRADWNDVMVDAMRWALQLKLQQHRRIFGRVLKSTGSLPIVERSRKDRFWGAILSEDEKTFDGENHLGKLLTELRDVTYDWVLAGNLTNPEGFLLSV